MALIPIEIEVNGTRVTVQVHKNGTADVSVMYDATGDDGRKIKRVDTSLAIWDNSPFLGEPAVTRPADWTPGTQNPRFNPGYPVNVWPSHDETQEILRRFDLTATTEHRVEMDPQYVALAELDDAQETARLSRASPAPAAFRSPFDFT